MERLHHGPIIASGILLGTGMGGFVDGVLLHQLLQWHNMLSSAHPPLDLVSMKYNVLWDGIFHVLTWAVTAAGLARLWRAGQRGDVAWSTRSLLGSLLVGWGLFNFVEGLLDHRILGTHHVHAGTRELAWDLGFLASGLLMLVVGWALIRTGRGGERPRPGTVTAQHAPSGA